MVFVSLTSNVRDLDKFVERVPLAILSGVYVLLNLNVKVRNKALLCVCVPVFAFGLAHLFGKIAL